MKLVVPDLNRGDWKSFVEDIERASDSITEWDALEEEIDACVVRSGLPHDEATGEALQYKLALALAWNLSAERVERLLMKLLEYELPPMLPFRIGRDLCEWARRNKDNTESLTAFYQSLFLRLEPLSARARREAAQLIDRAWP